MRRHWFGFLGATIGMVVMMMGQGLAGEQLKIGERSPQFSAVDLTGKTHTLSAYRGRVVVLHFWATWCPFCRRSIPSLVNLYTKRAPQGLQVLAISTDQSEETLRAFVQEQQLPYPVIRSQELALQYHLEGIPLTIVIGRDGLVQFVQEGAGDGFISVVERLVGS